MTWKVHTETTEDPVTGESVETIYLEDEEGNRQLFVPAKESTHLSWGIIAKLYAAGVTSPATARAMTDEDLLDIDGIGPVALREIRGVLG